MAKVLVTGGAGFIGSHLVDTLIERGDLVLVVDNLSTGKRKYINPKAKFFEIDLGNFEKIKPVFEGIDFVFHLAAVPRLMPSIEDPISAHRNNLTCALNVLTASKEAKVKKLIYASSASIYGNQSELPLREDMGPNPLSPYAIQKYGGELYCKIFSEIYKLPTISLRYFNVFGSRQYLKGDYALVIGIFLRQKKEGKPLTIVSDGTQRRDFTYVKDVVRATILAAEKDVDRGKVINVGAGHNYSINELAEIIGGPTVNIPPRPGEIKESLADISKAKRLLGWEPEYNLKTGLREMMEKYEFKK